MAGRALEEILRRLFIEQARIDGAVVQLAEGEERRERDAAVAAAERTVDEKREQKCRNLVGERGVGLAAEHRHLRALDGVEQPELRVDHAGIRLVAAELDADRAVQFDQILNAEVSRAGTLSR